MKTENLKTETPWDPCMYFPGNDEIIETKSLQNSYNKLADDLPVDLEITPEFQHTLDVLENTTDSLFITGKAGTGKSTLLKYYQSTTGKNVVVLAPTGIAALNVGGQTINSIFKLPPRLLQETDVQYHKKLVPLLNKLDMLILDEVSMVRADLMDAIDYSLRIHRNSNQPFGGVQMVFFGDLYQLPPVVRSTTLAKYFSDYYPNPYFYSAKVFKQCKFKTVELQKVFRQRDPNFISLLNKVRQGTLTSPELEKINERANTRNLTLPGSLTVTLASTNQIADNKNHRMLSNLNSVGFSYEATVEGIFNDKNYPTDYLLNLRVGAQVMMIKNDKQKRWVNGTLGKVVGLTPDEIFVEIDGIEFNIKREVWEDIEYRYDYRKKEIISKVKGSFWQFPIKLAWAVTIHKSQGKTFDNVVIDLGSGAFAHGQAYVALSRCKTLEGIYLTNPIRAKDIIVDTEVTKFMRDI